ncbi:phage tail protein [Pseudomonas fluorescens]|uniref:phage tail protein n=1 Tax=Pseudomonas fluorescens TaxID=294 RepID=UPI00177D242A|nr:phage tail protein [Pseudomonas fluorescens]MBD8192138.1 phage tail protein [Pseudomonas fluorescens]MBD8226762.1 phage tail protein [Pseudomonas fluorescens]MBD8784475.1 phage tail protein [Pseudomonas fluorescens]MBD8817155.1 phage tail protein [Pseudomonas fluorescens]
MSLGSYVHQTRDSGMINIQPSAVHSQALREFGQLVPKAAAAAQRRAINKTLGWLRTHIARAVGKQERIAIGAVRQRLRAYPVSGGTMRGKLWFGVNAIEASRIGKARQTRAGVSVAGRRYRGAFFKQVYGNSPDVWIRTSSKHFNNTDYPDSSQGRRRSGFVEESDNRFPLAKAKVSLDQVRPHFDSWVKRADERLLEILKQELNFELQKYLKGASRV